MKPGALLEDLRRRAAGLDREGSFLGWFNRKGRSDAEYIPLNDLRVLTIYKGHKTRTYKEVSKDKNRPQLVSAFPVYLICCPAIFEGGRVHIGGDRWYQRSHGPKTFFSREQVHGSRPSGEFRDIFSNHPHREVTLLTSIKQERAILDRQLCRWGLEVLADNVAEQAAFNPFGDEEIAPPAFLVPRKRDHLELREGKVLNELVESAVKREEWHVDGLVGLSAPDRGTACFDEESGVMNFVHDNGCVDHFRVAEVEEGVEDLIFRVFGVRDRVVLRSTLPAGKNVPMREGRALFAPVGGEPDVNAAQVMKYMAALTTGRDVNGTIALDIDVAIGHVEPLVHIGALLCRIQKLVNLEENLTYTSPGITIDLPHVCARMELQRNSHKFRKRVEAIKNTPGVEVVDTEEKVMHAGN